MSTPGPDSDPYGGASWDVQPAVPGWTAGQDWYTGPLYDDTGWHIDLADVDWGAGARRDRGADPRDAQSAEPPRAPMIRFDPNAAVPAPASYHRRAGRADRAAGLPGDRPAGVPADRPGGRHARHARPDDAAPPERAARPGPGGRRAAARGPVPDGRLRDAGPRRATRPAPDFPLPPDGQGRLDGSPRQDGTRSGYASPRPDVPRSEDDRPQSPGPAGSASIVRSSGVMAVGTLGSRLTGFLRTIAQSYAFGVAGVAAAYNLSNTLPNVVYNLALGGILTSVIVPLIVNASKRDSDRGDGYDQRMFTLVTAALLGVTLLAMLAAVPIVHLYAGSQIAQSRPTIHLSVIFALFFIPQIFFYGVSSLIGAILNSRGSFAAPMWTPIVNNAVVITVLALYVVIAGQGRGHAATITGTEVWLLGLGTTLGIVAQTVALAPALRRVGFRWRPRTDFHRAEVTEIGRMAGWMFGYIAATQIAFLVTTRVAGDASLAGVTDYNYAWLLFQLPYAVVGISVITALLPRMSAHAAEGRLRLVKDDFSSGVRLAATIVVPCSLVLAVLGPKIAEVFLAHGKTTTAEADYMGVIFAVFCLGLLPYMIFQLQLRVFYSLHDSKTPALIGLLTMTVNIAANLIALAVLPKDHLVAGLGAGFGLANIAGTVLAWRILSVRLRGLDGWLIGRSLVRMHAATIPAALLAVLIGLVTGNPYVVVIIGGGLAVGMYFLFARALRIDELTSLTRALVARVGR